MPSEAHEERASLLEALALLCGCPAGFRGFPDGTEPDVLQGGGSRLFVGDAKETETPGGRETRVRLDGYFGWVRAHLSAHGGQVLFALCFGVERQGLAWRRLLLYLAFRRHLRVVAAGLDPFSPDYVAWVLLARRPRRSRCPVGQRRTRGHPSQSARLARQRARP